MKLRDIRVGEKFERLTVVAFIGKDLKGSCLYLVKCKCKKRKPYIVAGWQLISGKVRSCGCLRLESIQKVFVTHGMTNTPEYKTWENIHSRCKCRLPKFWRNYGGRGIKVCKRWSKFENFYEDMGPRPSNEYSIDRRDSNKNYTPSNCYWATRAEQEATKRPYIRYNCWNDKKWRAKRLLALQE